MRFHILFDVRAGAFMYRRDETIDAPNLMAAVENAFDVAPQPPKDEIAELHINLHVKPTK